MCSGVFWFSGDEVSDNLLDATQGSGNYFVCARWANGEVGEIVDLYGNNEYRFKKYDYVGIIDKRMDYRNFHSSDEEWEYPIVASGIVGYWLHNRRNKNYNVKNLFETYYDNCLKAYCELRGKDPDSWNSDPTREFAMSVHIGEEIERIEKSKALFPFLRKSDVTPIIQITNNYLEFVKDKSSRIARSKEKLSSHSENQEVNRGRKKIDLKTITSSFNYLPNVVYRENRLQVFYNSLNQEFINADMKTFIDMFRNTTMKDTVVWKKSIKELKYLINQLVIKGWINWDDSYTKWQITCARFQIMVKESKKVDEGMAGDTYVIKYLNIRQFTNGGKALKKHDKLDKIIKILDPKINITKLLDEFVPDVPDEIKDSKDALANGLNTDIRH